MRNKRFGRWRPGALIAFGVVAGMLLLVEVLLDPLSSLMNGMATASTRADLLAAEARWRLQEIEGYTLDVEGYIPLACLIDARLTVWEGELVAVEGRRMPWDEASGRETIAPETWEDPFCSYSALRIEELHALIERELDRVYWSRGRLRVRFDPEYGYVTEYRYECCYQKGLLNPRCSDCNTWFRFSNFEPISGP